MVYINDTSGTITIPKHMETVSESGYTMVLTSNLSNDVVLVKNGGDISKFVPKNVVLFRIFNN